MLGLRTVQLQARASHERAVSGVAQRGLHLTVPPLQVFSDIAGSGNVPAEDAHSAPCQTCDPSLHLPACIKVWIKLSEVLRPGMGLFSDMTVIARTAELDLKDLPEQDLHSATLMWVLVLRADADRGFPVVATGHCFNTERTCEGAHCEVLTHLAVGVSVCKIFLGGLHIPVSLSGSPTFSLQLSCAHSLILQDPITV